MGRWDSIKAKYKMETDIPDWWDKIRYFSPLEMACKRCLADKVFNLDMDKGFMFDMDTFRRDIVRAPIIVSSGKRCKVHNAMAGGHDKSAHLLGKATDCYSPKYSNRQFWFLAEGSKLFYGMGSYPDSEHKILHLDQKKERFNRWVCKVINGVPTYIYLF